MHQIRTFIPNAKLGGIDENGILTVEVSADAYTSDIIHFGDVTLLSKIRDSLLGGCDIGIAGLRFTSPELKARVLAIKQQSAQSQVYA
jgi:hypothetical protein